MNSYQQIFVLEFRTQEACPQRFPYLTISSRGRKLVSHTGHVPGYFAAITGRSLFTLIASTSPILASP